MPTIDLAICFIVLVAIMQSCGCARYDKGPIIFNYRYTVPSRGLLFVNIFEIRKMTAVADFNKTHEKLQIFLVSLENNSNPRLVVFLSKEIKRATFTLDPEVTTLQITSNSGDNSLIARDIDLLFFQDTQQ
eukprot:959873_1